MSAAAAVVAAAAAVVAAAAAAAPAEQDENDNDPETAVIISTEHGEYPFPVPYLRPGRARRSGRSVASFRSSAGLLAPSTVFYARAPRAVTTPRRAFMSDEEKIRPEEENRLGRHAAPVPPPAGEPVKTSGVPAAPGMPETAVPTAPDTPQSPAAKSAKPAKKKPARSIRTARPERKPEPEPKKKKTARRRTRRKDFP